MRYRISLLILLAILVIGQIALATGVGDVEIRTNSGGPVIDDNNIWYCDKNAVEIWIKNDAPLYELSIGLEFTSSAGPIIWHQPYGTLPASSPVLYVKPAEASAFDLGLTVDVSQMPNRVFIHGVALNSPLQVHSSAACVFVLSLNTSSWSGPDIVAASCVDNIVYPVTGKWMFRDEAEYAPKFQGTTNNSLTDPSAPPVCFDAFTIPCVPPGFITTPPPVVSIPFSSAYSFDFQGSGCQPGVEFMVYYKATKGVFTDTLHGIYYLAPDGQIGTVVDTIRIYSMIDCYPAVFILTVNRINSGPPTISNSTEKLYIRQGTIGAVDYEAADPDSLDNHQWTFEFITQIPPEFPVTINSTTGEVTVDATTEIGSSQLYGYRLVTTDLGSLSDTSEFSVMITSSVAGDIDNNGLITISDVVYLINYIFAGGPPAVETYLADADCNGIVTISDAVFNIAYIFAGGPAPCGVVY